MWDRQTKASLKSVSVISVQVICGTDVQTVLPEWWSMLSEALIKQNGSNKKKLNSPSKNMIAKPEYSKEESSGALKLQEQLWRRQKMSSSVVLLKGSGASMPVWSLLYLKQPASRANGRPHSASCRPEREREQRGTWRIGWCRQRTCFDVLWQL